LLTSGLQPKAADGLPLIAKLAARVSGRLKLIAAAGIGRENCRRILADGRVNEIHVATAVRNDASGEVNPDLVRAIIAEASHS
jgi:copper homeostasis protein CutC